MNQKKFFRTTVVGEVLVILILGAMVSPVLSSLQSVFAAIPPAIQVTSPADGQALNSATVDVSGAADADVAVNVYIDGAIAGSTTADSLGVWSVNVGALPEGVHSLYAQASDSLGNIGTTATITFQADLTSPPVSITYPLNGSYANRPVIEGQSEPGASVTVFVYGREATVTADMLGYWFYQDLTLPDGNHSVYAVATDQAGNSQASEVANYILDMTRPRVLPDILPQEAMTQVPLDTVLRVYLVENSPLDPMLLAKALTLWQKVNTVNSGVYDAVYGTVYGVVYGPDNEPAENVSGTVYSTVYGTVFGDVYGNRLDTCYEIVFKPDFPLKPATTYEVSVNPQISDAAGNTVSTRWWLFTTVGGVATENPHGNYIENVNVCINCHTPHRASSPEIVESYGQPTALIDDYCNACHDGTSAPLPNNWAKANRHDYRMSREGTTGPSACTTCHDPHLKWTSQNPNLLQDFYYYPHNDPTNPYLPNSSEQALCELCHVSAIVDDPRVAYEQYRYKKWHTSSGATGNYSLCLSCHNGTLATDIKTFYTSSSRHIIQAKDGSQLNGYIPCSDCHETHGSNNLKLLKGALGHNGVQGFQTLSIVWDPETERRFCTGCHNNVTELYGVVAGFVYATPGHEPGNLQACSACHGGTPQAAAHGPQ